NSFIPSGPNRDRTGHLFHAMEALYRMSYGPKHDHYYNRFKRRYQLSQKREQDYTDSMSQKRAWIDKIFLMSCVGILFLVLPLSWSLKSLDKLGLNRDTWDEST